MTTEVLFRQAGRNHNRPDIPASLPWILAFAGMTVGAASAILSGIAKGYRNGDKPIPTPVVIPAKAGIQWFRQSIPAKRE